MNIKHSLCRETRPFPGWTEEEEIDYYFHGESSIRGSDGGGSTRRDDNTFRCILLLHLSTGILPPIESQCVVNYSPPFNARLQGSRGGCFVVTHSAISGGPLRAAAAANTSTPPATPPPERRAVHLSVGTLLVAYCWFPSSFSLGLCS